MKPGPVPILKIKHPLCRFKKWSATHKHPYGKDIPSQRSSDLFENDQMEQINLALLFGEQSALPFYYRKLPGNISDVKTVKNLLADLDFFEYKRIKLVSGIGITTIRI
ncbi:MAG TPA: hypothetical protein VM577_07645 [Anaerovoracaceae bacterium]|nr:hypothetical protein [Anaerovoracaceae bacterium]